MSGIFDLFDDFILREIIAYMSSDSQFVMRATCSRMRCLINEPRLCRGEHTKLTYGEIMRLPPTIILGYAAYNGSFILLKVAESRGQINLNLALECAAAGGQLEMARELIARGATAISAALSRACGCAGPKMVAYLLSLDNVPRDILEHIVPNIIHGADILRLLDPHTVYYHPGALMCACHIKNIKLVEFILKNTTVALDNYAEYINGIDVVKLFVAHGLKDFDRVMISASMRGDAETVSYMIQCGARDFTRALNAIYAGSPNFKSWQQPGLFEVATILRDELAKGPAITIG